jgi:hypothetical protein
MKLLQFYLPRSWAVRLVVRPAGWPTGQVGGSAGTYITVGSGLHAPTG